MRSYSLRQCLMCNGCLRQCLWIPRLRCNGDFVFLQRSSNINHIASGSLEYPWDHAIFIVRSFGFRAKGIVCKDIKKEVVREDVKSMVVRVETVNC